MRPLLFSTLLLSLLLSACKNTVSGSAATTESESTPLAQPEESTLPESTENLAPVLDTNAIIEAIREEFTAITHLKEAEQLRLDSLSYECGDEPKGGYVGRFYQNEDLRLLEHEFYLGDHSWVSTHWYFKDGNCFFVFRQEGSWRFDGQEREDGTMGTRDDISESRYYFGPEGQPLKVLDKSYTIFSRNETPLNPDEVPNEEVAELSYARSIAEEASDLLQVKNGDQGLLLPCDF